MKKMMFSAFAAAVLAVPALAGAQSPSPSPAPSPQTPPSQTPPPATAPSRAGDTQSRSAKADKVTGELVKVDAVAKKLTIKGTDGTETDFTYSDATEVAGGQDVAGLATKAGTKVTVHFKSDMGTKTATKIEMDSADRK
jgi:hypothetical protein